MTTAVTTRNIDQRLHQLFGPGWEKQIFLLPMIVLA